MSRRLVIGKLDWYHFEKQVLPTSVWSLGWTEVCFWVRSIACAWVWREMSLFGILRDLDWSFRSIDLHIWWHSFICIPILPMLVQYGPCYRCSLTIRLQQVQESRCTNASLACCCRVMQCIDYMFALFAQECCFFDRPGSISQAHHWIVVDDRSGVLIEVSTEDNLRFDWWCSLTLIGSGNVMYHDMRWMGQRSSAHGVSFCVHSIGERFFLNTMLPEWTDLQAVLVARQACLFSHVNAWHFQGTATWAKLRQRSTRNILLPSTGERENRHCPCTGYHWRLQQISYCCDWKTECHLAVGL